MRKIGDNVWTARLKHREFTETCPDCLGDKTVTLVLKNGESHQLECHTCNPGGYQPSRGYIVRSQYHLAAELRTIEAMEVSATKTNYRFYDWSSEVVFDTEAEALVEAEKIRTAKEDDDHQRFVWKKEDSRRTWAWNAAYYRRQIKDAKQTLAYAEARLGICKAKAKEPAPQSSPDQGTGGSK